MDFVKPEQPRKTRHIRQRSASLPFEALHVQNGPHALRTDDAVHSRRSEASTPVRDDVRKISTSQIEALIKDPDSVPIRPAQQSNDTKDGLSALAAHHARLVDTAKRKSASRRVSAHQRHVDQEINEIEDTRPTDTRSHALRLDTAASLSRPAGYQRTMSMPSTVHRQHSLLGIPFEVPSRAVEAATPRDLESDAPVSRPAPLTSSSILQNPGDLSPASEVTGDPLSSTLPLPPMSMPTYLELELATKRPSPLYIYRPSATDTPFEPTKIKLERLLNFVLLPPQLEHVLVFGALTCLDAWLYTFTILPLRFLKAAWIFVDWFGHNIFHELRDFFSFTWQGLRRVRQRRRQHARETQSSKNKSQANGVGAPQHTPATTRPSANSSRRTSLAAEKQRASEKPYHNYRVRSKPSRLLVAHKADLLQGLLIALTCMILMRFDASRMYHAIRGQAAMKLYVIYNCLEVFDRLFSAFGQDVLECLFSAEVLERHSSGRSQVWRPLWMFALALVYCVVHATALLYQVVTLNVAVNSYSNALLTLLMSNQFVEIKGAVFKKIEKENLFQLTCADVVERFQLWLMLLVIGLRNIVEVGGFSFASVLSEPARGSATPTANAPNQTATGPLHSFSILPASFTMVPSLPAMEVLTPFLIVLASETIVDWLKHAYINKFNALSPKVYGRFLDVLAKDYYLGAFSSPFSGLVRRVGLPVIPLACLFIRATLQTYHMFLAANISPISSASFTSTTSIATQEDSEGPTRFIILEQIRRMFRRALGQSSLGGGSAGGMAWSLDDAIALLTMVVFFLVLYLILLAFKLALGMLLLRAARARYNTINERSQEKISMPETKRIGGWSAAELGDERRKIIYEDDRKGLAKMRERDARTQKLMDSEISKGNADLERVQRYSMAAKRIW